MFAVSPCFSLLDKDSSRNDSPSFSSSLGVGTPLFSQNAISTLYRKPHQSQLIFNRNTLHAATNKEDSRQPEEDALTSGKATVATTTSTGSSSTTTQSASSADATANNLDKDANADDKTPPSVVELSMATETSMLQDDVDDNDSNTDKTTETELNHQGVQDNSEVVGGGNLFEDSFVSEPKETEEDTDETADDEEEDTDETADEDYEDDDAAEEQEEASELVIVNDEESHVGKSDDVVVVPEDPVQDDSEEVEDAVEDDYEAANMEPVSQGCLSEEEPQAETENDHVEEEKEEIQELENTEDTRLISSEVEEVPPSLPSTTLTVPLLLMNSRTGSFEFLRLSVTSEQATVRDLFAQVSNVATDDSVRNQTYIGICTSNAVQQSPEVELKQITKGFDVMVGIPEGMTGEECCNLARRVLVGDKVISMLQSKGIETESWEQQEEQEQEQEQEQQQASAETTTKQKKRRGWAPFGKKKKSF